MLVATVSFSVAISGILFASEPEAFFYPVLMVIGALLAMKYNKKIHAPKNSGWAD
ncbi:MAG: hypothetical protein ACI8R9_000364 [Paraglaciecola sp.]|jgi:hypothetical protein